MHWNRSVMSLRGHVAGFVLARVGSCRLFRDSFVLLEREDSCRISCVGLAMSARGLFVQTQCQVWTAFLRASPSHCCGRALRVKEYQSHLCVQRWPGLAMESVSVLRYSVVQRFCVPHSEAASNQSSYVEALMSHAFPSIRFFPWTSPRGQCTYV